MNTGTQAAKEAGNMVDLDSNPTKLIEVVEVAKQLLITRGSLTTFSIANDVAKYFAIIPAMFVVAYPKLRVLNVMHLDNPHTAILSAVIYNAVIIPALIPLALRGVKFKPLDGAAILRRNTLIRRTARCSTPTGNSSAPPCSASHSPTPRATRCPSTSSPARPTRVPGTTVPPQARATWAPRIRRSLTRYQNECVPTASSTTWLQRRRCRWTR